MLITTLIAKYNKEKIKIIKQKKTCCHKSFFNLRLLFEIPFLLICPYKNLFRHKMLFSNNA